MWSDFLKNLYLVLKISIIYYWLNQKLETEIGNKK